MPDFMNAWHAPQGHHFPICSRTPNYAGVAQAYKSIATWNGKIYGAGFTPDVSLLMWNKDLFKKAGLDPGKGADDARLPKSTPTPRRSRRWAAASMATLPAIARLLQHLRLTFADDGGHRFLVMLPAKPGDPALTGDGVKAVLTEMHVRCGPKAQSRRAHRSDTGANFVANFENGNIGIQGAGGFLISDLKQAHPEINFGVGFLLGASRRACRPRPFVGGDVIAIPAASKHSDIALKFIHWELTD